MSGSSTRLTTGLIDWCSRKSAIPKFKSSDWARTTQLKYGHSIHSPAIFLNPSMHLPPANRASA
jgi:hypothetical protein